MIITLGSWMIILILAILLGDAFLYFVGEGAYKKTTRWDVCIVCGLLVLNVYAQFFSIFHKVGTIALGTIALFSILWGIYRFKEYCNLFATHQRVTPWKICVVMITVTYIVIWTIKDPDFVDTYLYHAQAIRWIEEYGVVPGLGNLHNRFAYNSAFMPLQALFSFSWILNISLHSLNGFLGTFFVVYATITNNLFTPKKSRLSDFFKIIVVIYVYFSRTTISSPGSDLLAMLLVLYIIIKWCECFENEEEVQAYGVLCLVAVWAMSVKLSAAIAVLLVVYPAIILIKEKRYILIFKDIVSGILIAAPWLIRNVIISGYLLYPYSQIDLFNFDWEMPKSLLDYDKKEIIVWGREVRDVSKFEQPMREWIGIWFENQMLRNKLFIIGGFLATILLLGFVIYYLFRSIKKKKINKAILGKKQEMLVVAYVIFGLVFWLLSAPLLRYGVVYLLMPIAIVAYIVKEFMGDILFRKTIVYMAVPLVCCFYLYKNEDFRLVEPQDYWHIENEKILWNELDIYIPSSDDRMSGYYNFPSTPEKRILEGIVPRGDSLEEGFRIKQE